MSKLLKNILYLFLILVMFQYSILAQPQRTSASRIDLSTTNFNPATINQYITTNDTDLQFKDTTVGSVLTLAQLYGVTVATTITALWKFSAALQVSPYFKVYDSVTAPIVTYMDVDVGGTTVTTLLNVVGNAQITGLTNTRIPYVSNTGGLLADSANLTWTNGTNMLTAGNLTVGPITQNVTASAAIAHQDFTADANGAQETFKKSRGASSGTNTIVLNGDEIGSLIFQGANGTGYTDAAKIKITVDGVPGAITDMPGKIDFQTTPDGSGTLSSRFTIANDGTVDIASNKLKLAGAATNGALIQGNGTNFVATGYNVPTAASASGSIWMWDGLGNVISSTATYPATAGAMAGKFIRSDGTNWLAATTTIPDTFAISTIPYASAANVLSALATANSSVLVTNSSGVPAWGTSLPAITAVNVTDSGLTSGRVTYAGASGLLSDSANLTYSGGNLTVGNTGNVIATGSLYAGNAVGGTPNVIIQNSGWNNIAYLGIGYQGDTLNIAANGKTASATTINLAYTSNGSYELALDPSSAKFQYASAGTNPRTFTDVLTLASGGGATFSGAITTTNVTDSGLTSGRVTYAGTSGLLKDSANLTFDGTTLTAANVTNSGAISGDRLTFTGANVADTTIAGGTIEYMTMDGVTLTATKGFVATRAGSITGISVIADKGTAANAGTPTTVAEVLVVGGSTYSLSAQAAITTSDVSWYGTQARGTTTFSAGNVLVPKLRNSALGGNDQSIKNVIMTVELYYN